MANQLPARPNLDHLRKQAKTLLAGLKAGDKTASQAFLKHLPAARGMSVSKLRGAGYRLADAQSVVARSHGFASWTALTHHVDELRRLEGEWRFVGLQIDGSEVPPGMLTASRLLMDGDRFRMESPEANYEGRFTIDAGTEPMQIDIDFVEGPEAGNSSHGIFERSGDQLTMCLGLVGSSRPRSFSTAPGSGHALERLRRASASRPADVTGGTPPPSETAGPSVAAVNPVDFDHVTMTPLMRQLEGEWIPTALIRDGQETKAEWLPFGSRIATGNEVKVVFGGQVMVHAKARFDEHTTPIAVDYLNLAGSHKGKLSLGIMEWAGDEVRFLMAAPGRPRPADFATPPGKGLTLSQWRRKPTT